MAHRLLVLVEPPIPFPGSLPVRESLGSECFVRVLSVNSAAEAESGIPLLGILKPFESLVPVSSSETAHGTLDLRLFEEDGRRLSGLRGIESRRIHLEENKEGIVTAKKEERKEKKKKKKKKKLGAGSKRQRERRGESTVGK